MSKQKVWARFGSTKEPEEETFDKVEKAVMQSFGTKIPFPTSKKIRQVLEDNYRKSIENKIIVKNCNRNILVILNDIFNLSKKMLNKYNYNKYLDLLDELLNVINYY